jgi:LysM repeat protein
MRLSTVECMGSENRRADWRGRARRLALGTLPLALLLVAGCGTFNKARPRAGVDRSPTTVGRQPAGSRSASLASIINDTIQQGHYAEGEVALRRYLAQHPGDQAARGMLRQLTAAPESELGSKSRDYTVQPGDSYSSLAARYLGDASLFVVLARYNNSTNPSDLRVGQTVRLPVSGRASNEVERANISETSPEREIHPTPAAVAEDVSPTTSARQWQAQSMSLLGKGQKREALRRLDHALTLDPQLKSSGPAEAPLRRQLVGNYHEQAVVLYRDQHLDAAIALWDRVLAIDPTFEPAVIYRTRALELKRRLKQL